MIKCDYLRNYEVLKDPSEKDEVGHSHYNFKTIQGTLYEMIMDNVAGHQIIPGEFVWQKSPDDRDILRSKVCWRSGNVIMAEFDTDVPYYTLQDVVDDDEFIRENAYALTHSVSSYYNGNSLRYRVWFALSYTGNTSHESKDVKFKFNTWEFAKDKILERYNDGQTRFPVADRNGSRLTSGAYGLFGAKHLILGNEVSLEVRKMWASAYREWESNRIDREHQPVDADSFDDISQETLREIKQLSFREDGKGGEVSIGYVQCVFGGNHDDDENNPKTVVFKSKNRLTFYCHKCPQHKTYRKKLTRKDIIRKIRSGDMPHLSLTRPPSKLHIQDKDIIYGKIEDNRDAINKFLDTETRVLAVALETGGGKTEAAIKYAAKSDICLVLPTHKLGDDIEKRLSEDDYQIWKSRNYDYAENEPDMEIYEDDLPPQNIFGQMTKMCVSPRKCSDYGSKGGKVIKTICTSCLVYLDCKEAGYLSQFESFPNRQIQIIKMKDVFTNPQHSGFAKQIIADSERVAFVDEAKAHDFYNKTELYKKDIQDLVYIWNEKSAGDLCQFFIEHWNDYQKWKDILVMSETYYQDIMHELSSIRCVITQTRTIDSDYSRRVFNFELRGLFEEGTSRKGMAYMPKDDDAFDFLTDNGEPVLYAGNETGMSTDLTLSLDQCVKMNLIKLDDMDNMPKVYNSENNWYSELSRSIEHYGQLTQLDSDTEEVVIFATPPVIFDKLSKFVAMSATLDEYHFNKAFAGYTTEFLNPPPTPFNKDARLFQLRTGTTPIGYWQENDEFTQHALNKLEIIEQKIEAEADRKYGIITSHQVIKMRQDVWADMDAFIEHTHFGNTEGLNEMFKDIDTIIIMGSFQLPPTEIRDRAMLLFGEEKEILSFERYKDDDNNSFYEDKRVQSVQNQAIIGEIIQGIGRGRLNLYPKRVILLSSYKIVNYSERAVLFDMADLEVAHAFSDLEEIVQVREKEESEMGDAEKMALQMYKKGNSNAEVMEETGLTLYALKNMRRKHNIVIENKHRREIRLFLYKNKTVTLHDIAESVNIPKNKIQYHINQMLKENVITRIKHGTYQYGKV